jgi:hypothetical protein
VNIMRRILHSILLFVMLFMGMAACSDIQIPTDIGTAKELLTQGYTPMYFADNEGNRAVVMIMGYRRVQEAELQSRCPMCDVAIELLEWAFGAEPLNEPEVGHHMENGVLVPDNPPEPPEQPTISIDHSQDPVAPEPLQPVDDPNTNPWPIDS